MSEVMNWRCFTIHAYSNKERECYQRDVPSSTPNLFKQTLHDTDFAVVDHLNFQAFIDYKLHGWCIYLSLECIHIRAPCSFLKLQVH